METLGWFRVGAEWVEGLGEGPTEGVRPTTWARGLIVFPSRGESAWGRSGGFLSPSSAVPGGLEESVPVACGARVCGTFRDDVGTSFEANMPDDSAEDMGVAATPFALSILVRGWSGGCAPGEDHKQVLREYGGSPGHFGTAKCVFYSSTSFHDSWMLPRYQRLSGYQQDEALCSAMVGQERHRGKRP